MYIESPQGSELGFPQHYMRRGWREHLAPGGPGAGMMMQTQPNYAPPSYAPPAPGVGPVTAMGPGPGMGPGWHHRRHRRHHQMFGEGASDYVTMMGPGDAVAPAAVAPAVAPPAPVASPVAAPNHTALIVGGVMVLGLAFVLYKATR